jgi:hypothetical protein
MTEEFFARESPRASGSNTLLSILILAAVTMIVSTISSLLGGGLQMIGMPPEYQETFAASLGSLVMCSLCGGLLGSIVGFYLGNGFTYLGARIFGGSGDFGVQAYLTSLPTVPIGIVAAFLGLAYLVPYVGPCLGGLVTLALSVYAIILNVRAVKVAHNLSTGAAIGAVLLLPLVLIPGIACLVIVALALLGPAISNVFENIVISI